MLKSLALIGLFIVLQGISVNAVASDKQCKDGDCQTALGVKLDCPSSGGPECGSKECCQCRCIAAEDGTVSATNVCIKCPTMVDIDGLAQGFSVVP